MKYRFLYFIFRLLWSTAAKHWIHVDFTTNWFVQYLHESFFLLMIVMKYESFSALCNALTVYIANNSHAVVSIFFLFINKNLVVISNKLMKYLSLSGEKREIDVFRPIVGDADKVKLWISFWKSEMKSDHLLSREYKDKNGSDGAERNNNRIMKYPTNCANLYALYILFEEPHLRQIYYLFNVLTGSPRSRSEN